MQRRVSQEQRLLGIFTQDRKELSIRVPETLSKFYSEKHHVFCVPRSAVAHWSLDLKRPGLFFSFCNGSSLSSALGKQKMLHGTSVWFVLISWKNVATAFI